MQYKKENEQALKLYALLMGNLLAQGKTDVVAAAKTIENGLKMDLANLLELLTAEANRHSF